MSATTYAATAAPSSRALSFPVFASLMVVADLVLIGVASYGSLLLAGAPYGDHPPGFVVAPAVAGALALSIALSRAGAYRRRALLSGATGVRLLIKPVAYGALVLIAFLFMQGQQGQPFRLWPCAWVGSVGLVLGATRIPLARRVRRWAAAGLLARKIAIVGQSAFSDEFIERLGKEPHAYRIVGLYDDRMSRRLETRSGMAVLGTVADLVQRSREERIEVIVVALPLSAVDRIRAILDELGSTVADIVLTTDLAGLRYSQTQFAGIGANTVVSVREAPLKDWRALQKAVLDYGVGLLALLVLSPVLLLTALLIRLDSPGPVLFRQPRLGFNNRMFTCYKFRSMRHGSADLLADRQTTRGDARITRVGRVIRKLSIDELPQLLNVLNGTMSLVGPRPHAPNTKAADRLFAEVVQQYALRHRVKPGITGWAQVNGWRGETATVAQIEGRVACDLFYIEHWSIGLDLRIMVMTLLREIRSRHAF